ncbi:MAG: SDR family NAD(P)-dependent oxidoreductase [Marmoricola sp.]
MRAADKTWVVTGASNGMGRELTLQLLKKGARVAAVGRSSTGLARTAALAGAGARLSTHVVDITDRAAVRALPDTVVAAHGAVDGLINNAGIIQPFIPINEIDDETIRSVMEVNFFGTLDMTRAFLPRLLLRPEAQVVNVASMGGFFPFPGQTVYGASKAAMRLLTEGLYTELLDTNVAVTLIFPGAVDTGIFETSGLQRPDLSAVGRSASLMMTAPKAASRMIAGIEKGKLHVYVGADSKAMSLAIKIAPRTAIKLVRNQMRKMLEEVASKNS